MKKKLSTMPFSGTPEQEAQLKEVIAKYAGSVAGEKTNKGKITVGAKIAL